MSKQLIARLLHRLITRHYSLPDILGIRITRHPNHAAHSAERRGGGKKMKIVCCLRVAIELRRELRQITFKKIKIE